jgi:hypothetical protein
MTMTRYDYTRRRVDTYDARRRHKIVVCPRCGRKGAFHRSYVPPGRHTRVHAWVVHTEEHRGERFSLETWVATDRCTLDEQEDIDLRERVGMQPLQKAADEEGYVE